MTELLLEARHLSKRYGAGSVVDDLSFADRARRMPRRDRSQRRRQDHDHPHVPGPHGARRRRDRGAAACRCRATRCAIKAQLGVVSQFDTLDPDFTLRREPDGLRPLLRHGGREIRERIPQLLEFARCTHKADAKPGELSGGMRRRLSLARALVNDPQAADAGRAHHRARPAGAPPDVGAAAGAAAAGQVDPADDALHGRSRAPVLAAAGARPWPQDRRRAAARPDRASTSSPTWSRRTATARWRSRDRRCRVAAARVEVSGETVFFYTQDAGRCSMRSGARTEAAHLAPAGEPRGPVPQAHRPADPGGG